MKTKLLLLASLLAFYALNSKAQNSDLKKAKQEKLRKAKQEVFENKWVAGYYGGTKALIGVNFYTMFADKPGLYLSIRGGSEKGEDYDKAYDNKELALNAGITLPIYYPVAMYLAAGIGGYSTYTPTAYGSNEDIVVAVGAETSAGLIFHIKKLKIQGGVSFVNLKYPDATFGIGYSLF